MVDQRRDVLVVAVDLVTEFAGTLEGDHFSVSENHLIACGGVAAFALTLGLDAEFAETGDENIFSCGEGVLDDGQQLLNDVYGSLLGESHFAYAHHNVIFCKCHTNVLLKMVLL